MIGTELAKLKLYVAGPMSGLPKLNFPAFHAAAEALRSCGFDVVNPAELCPDPSASWHACMRADIRELMTCDGVALLDGWEGSRGARIERELAADLEMPAQSVAEWINRFAWMKTA